MISKNIRYAVTEVNTEHIMISRLLANRYLNSKQQPVTITPPTADINNCLMIETLMILLAMIAPNEHTIISDIRVVTAATV